MIDDGWIVWGDIPKLKPTPFCSTNKQLILTDLGQKILGWYASLQRGTVRVENMMVKFSIIKDAGVSVDWEKYALRNIRAMKGRIDNVKVNRVGNTIIIYVPLVHAKNPLDALFEAYEIVHDVKLKLEQRFGMELGKGMLCRKVEFACQGDPVARTVSKWFNVRTPIGHIDRSPPYKGDIEYYDPELAIDYLEIPLLMKETIRALVELRDAIDQLRDSIEQRQEGCHGEVG